MVISAPLDPHCGITSSAAVPASGDHQGGGGEADSLADLFAPQAPAIVTGEINKALGFEVAEDIAHLFLTR